jgi:AraC-like DNA-binding protein
MENDKGVLLLGISCDYFTDFIQQFDEDDMDTILILHGNGEVITHPDASQQLVDYSGKEYAAKIQKNELPSGYFLQKLEKEETYISFRKSSELDWTFISMVPYKKMMAPLRSLRTRVLLITFSILIAGVLASYLLAVLFYRPMRRLEQQSESLVQSKAVLNLLKNQYADTNATNAKIIDAAFREPFYVVCLIAIDGKEVFEKLTVKEQGAARNRIITIAAEKLKSYATAVDHAIPYQTEIAFVLHIEEGLYPPLDSVLTGACEAIRSCCPFPVSAASGPMVNSVFAINDSFEETEKLLLERFFTGPGKVISKELLPVRHEVPYPQTIGEDLCKAVLVNDYKSIAESIDNFKAILEKTTYEYARLHINMLVMQLLSACLAGFSQSAQVDADAFHSLVGELQKLETLDAVCSSLAGFCRSLLPNSPQDGTALRMVNDALVLMAERYGDPLFSVNAAAEHFNITPAYFNRIFKKQKGRSFSEYLNEYRLEIACKLLRDTNQAVGAIASAVGISNATYFFTLFKKIYNQTPLEFRIHGTS